MIHVNQWKQKRKRKGGKLKEKENNEEKNKINSNLTKTDIVQIITGMLTRKIISTLIIYIYMI